LRRDPSTCIAILKEGVERIPLESLRLPAGHQAGGSRDLKSSMRGCPAGTSPVASGGTFALSRAGGWEPVDGYAVGGSRYDQTCRLLWDLYVRQGLDEDLVLSRFEQWLRESRACGSSKDLRNASDAGIASLVRGARKLLRHFDKRPGLFRGCTRSFDVALN